MGSSWFTPKFIARNEEFFQVPYFQTHRLSGGQPDGQPSDKGALEVPAHQGSQGSQGLVNWIRLMVTVSRAERRLSHFAISSNIYNPIVIKNYMVNDLHMISMNIIYSLMFSIDLSYFVMCWWAIQVK